MLILLLISLYASRVILQTLGIEDYGIYNVVGGLVVLFSFINGALTVGTQRHLSYELGKKDGNLPQIFTACLHVHFWMSIVALFLLETIGLWFLNTKMNFPDGKLISANIVYQFSILCFICKIIQTPYEAAIVAYEKFSFYAYFGIVEAILKLSILFLLLVIAYDKLISYSVLHFSVIFLMLIGIVTYCHAKLAGIRIEAIKDKTVYKYIISFSSWTLLGSLSVIMESQGLNLLINIFYGVALNAAVGIAGQVRGALSQFVNGFQQALNPQLVKSQSSENRERQEELICKSSKFSFFILFLLAFPIVVNLKNILEFWLGNVPPYTVEICCLIIMVSLFECLSSPLYTTISAIGKIKVYQIYVFIFRSLSLILGYVICKIGCAPYVIFYVPCLVAVILLLYRLLFIRKAICLPIKKYLEDIIYPIIRTILLIIIPVFGIEYSINCDFFIKTWILKSLFVAFFSLLVIMFFGLKSSERTSLANYFRSKTYKTIL
jgi:O-antigen/teichoic acid export membrane protein